MKSTLLAAFIFSSLISFGQKTAYDTGRYVDGRICWTEILYRNQNSKSWDFITYYDDNERKYLEEITDTLVESHKMINAWLPDGKQTLKDGNGIYIVSGEDSAIYTVKDSLYNGFCQSYFRFRNGSIPWKNLPWKLKATGNYSNGVKVGEWIFRNSDGSNDVILTYKNDTVNGNCSFYYESTGILSETGIINGNCNKTGLWKKYDTLGNLSGEYNYQNGQKMGTCTLYYANGKIKAKGQYKQVSHTFRGNLCENPNNPGTFVKCKNKYDNVPAKTGMWYFYDENGNLTGTKKYRSELDEMEYCSQFW